MKFQPILIWTLRLVAAGIMLQTLYFKFTAHEQSVKLFTELAMEPWGRIGTGVLELIASFLILNPKTTGWGAGLGASLMTGAIFFHITKIKLDFDGDYGLFTYAVIVFVCCVVLFFIFRNQVFKVFKPVNSH
jgi:uncharacterized membrane protein YphA (DoxX/SURF4 family)